MKPERFQEVAALFREAGQRRPTERALFLEEACGDDAELRAQVEVLLAADETHPGFFTESRLGEHAARRVVEVLAPEATEGRGHPQAIGNYRIINVLGEGGMGVVYRAEQTEPMQRTVAVKLIKLGMDSARVVARFDAERQALALMDHPNVAQVHDGGMTADGRPYFVMEYVAGIPITDYCDRERLTTRRRLDLFLQVCRGVQHAHQKGIIHRDIKPSNVLVMRQDDRPVPKIIDFGVAKATARRLTERTLFTEQGQLIGTPEYMSPEQAGTSGLDVDTRSDVYSLGVILYQLLTGTLPFDPRFLRAAGFAEIHRIIREMEPPTPSSRLSTLGAEPVNRHNGAAPQEIAARRDTEFAALQRQVKGDLDWIVMKCLEKDVSRRYASANELAADIERHLNHQPVEAGPPSTAYRVRKFVRRNRTLVGAAGSIAALLLLATIGMSALAAWALHERDRASNEALNARQAEAEQTRLAKAEAEARDKAETEAEMATSINAFLRDMLTAPDPWTSAAGPEEAREVKVIQVLERAAETASERFGNKPVFEAEVRMTLGETFYHLHDLAKAEAQFELAAALMRQSFGPEHSETLTPLNWLALLYQDQGELDKAEPLCIRVLEGKQRALGEEDPETLTAMNNLGLLYRRKGQHEKAEPLYVQCLALRRKVQGDDHPLTMGSMNNLGMLYVGLGQYDRAEPLLIEALERRRRVLTDEHPDTQESINNLAMLYAELRRYDEAEPLYLRSLELSRRVLGEDHKGTLIVMANLANMYSLADRLDEAEPLLKKLMESFRRVQGEEHTETMIITHNYARLLTKQGKYREAEPLFRKVLETLRRDLTIEHRLTLTALNSLADLYVKCARYEEAEPLHRESVAVHKRVMPAGFFGTGLALLGHGRSLVGLGRYAEAEPVLLEAHQVLDAALDATDDRVVKAVRALAELYTAWHEVEPDKGYNATAAAWRAKLADLEGSDPDEER